MKGFVVSWNGGVRAFRGLVGLVVGLVGAATLVGLLDSYVWVFELADVFRVQYVVVLAAAAVAAAVLRRPRLATLAVALAAINVAAVGVPLAGSATAAPPAATGSLRVVVANVEVGNRDFAAVERLVAETKPDLLGIVELTPGMTRHLRRALPEYKVHVLSPRDDAYGIGVLSRVPLQSARVVRLPRADGPPTIVVRAPIGGTSMTVVVTHVHTPFAGSIHVRQLQALAEARSGWGERVAVCGDFNTPPWSGPVREFVSETGLHDLYADRAWRGYSWPTWNWALRVPLDNCFAGRDVVVRSHHDGPDVGSDHFPLVVDLSIVRNAASMYTRA